MTQNASKENPADESGARKGVMRIQGAFPDLTVKDRGGADSRHASTLALLREVFTLYPTSFAGLNFDFFIGTFDNPDSCNVLAKWVPYVLTYSVTPQCRSNILPVPDFVFGGWPEVGIDDYTATTAAIAAAGQQPPRHDKIFWIGNARMDPMRQRLIDIGHAHPETMEFINMQWHREEKGDIILQTPSAYLSLPDHAAYSMLLDIRGSGYSGRLKLLLHAARPVFLVERPFREFFYQHLRPFEHYMPVREDLSDLTARVEQVRKDKDLARRLGQGAADFAAQYLTRAYALSYLRDILVGIGRSL